jgi:hypothetical protein
MRKESGQHISHRAEPRAAAGMLRSGIASFPREFRMRSGVMRLFASILLYLVTAMPSASADQLTELVEKAGLQIVSQGSSDGDIQRDTRRRLPLQLLTQRNRQRAEEVLDDCSQFRRLPGLRYSIDRPIYSYLLQHPDVAVSTWRAMGISRFEMLQTGPMEYEAKAVDGSEGIADILYQDETQTLFICEGFYHNVLLPRPLKASALIWFRADYAPNSDGCHVVSQSVDVFARFPSASVSALAKMLTPVTNSMMDRNLYEISLYASMMSRAVRDEPEWIIQVAKQLDGVLPQRPEELIAVARLPRKSQNDKPGRAADGAPAGGGTTTSAVPIRDPIVSPKLLFFDPSPREPGSDDSTALPASSGGSLLIMPASRRIMLDQPTESGSSRMTGPEPRAKAEAASAVTERTTSNPPPTSTPTKRNQTVPPAGSTATGPVGSRTGTAGNSARFMSP